MSILLIMLSPEPGCYTLPIVFLPISPYAFHSLALHPFLSLPFEAIATPCISNDVGALGGTTEAAGGTNDDVAGGGGEDSAGWWWCRALTVAPIVAGRRDGGLFASTGAQAPQYGEFFYVMNSAIGWFRRYFLRRLTRLLQKISSFVG